jgi:hypothetical protein
VCEGTEFENKIKRKSVEVEDGKERQLCGEINWQILWQLIISALIESASALLANVEWLVELPAQ